MANCGLFSQEMLVTANVPPFNGKFLIGPHHVEWSRALATNQNNCMIAARGGGKSEFMAKAYPLWMSVRFPKRDGLIVSGSDTQALKILFELKTMIESSPKLAWLKPKKASGWAAERVELTNGVVIRAAGYTSQLRGLHPKWLVFDDALSDKDLISAKIRQANIALFKTKFFPMAMPDTQIVVVGTPYHASDLYADLRMDPNFSSSVFPAIVDYGAPTERSFWPEYRSLEYLKRLAKSMTSIQFAREYLCVDGKTPIRTRDRGYVPIAEITTEDHVLTHEGTWQRVLRRHTNARNGRRMVRVRTSNNVGHVVTEDHELLVVKTGKSPNKRKRLDDVQWLQAGKIAWEKGERVYLKVPVPPLRTDVEISRDRAFLSGWYLAEGHCHATNQAVYFSLGVNDPFEELNAAALREFGKPLVLYDGADQGSCKQYALLCKEARDWFCQLGRVGEVKHFGPLLDASEEMKRVVIRAYLQGDGHYSGRSYVPVSISSRLIADLSDVLLSLGIGCQIASPIPAKPYSIEGRTGMSRPAYRLRIGGTNLDALFGGSTGRRSSCSFVRDGFLYSRVKSVETVSEYAEDVVYDLHVENVHSYTGQHGTFHNCQPLSDASSLFPAEFFGANHALVRDLEIGAPREHFMNAGVTSFFVGVDFGLSANTGSDYTVIFVIGRDKFQNTWIVDIVRRHGLGFQDQLEEIRRVCERYRPEFAYLEGNQAQSIFGKELIRTTDLPIRLFHTGEAKHSMQKGVPGLRLQFENRKVRIPFDNPGDERLAAFRAWVCEMGAMTLVDGRVTSTESHDDTVMAYWIACQAARDTRFAPVFGPDASYSEPLDELADVDPEVLERLGIRRTENVASWMMTDEDALQRYGAMYDFGFGDGVVTAEQMRSGGLPTLNELEGFELVPAKRPLYPGATVLRRKHAQGGPTGPTLDWKALIGGR